jgi:hypothetical protein
MSPFVPARIVTALLLVLAVFGATAPAAGADDATGTARPSASARTTSHGTHLTLRGDTATQRRSGRSGLTKWNARTLYYYETIPAKWDWSLTTAVTKWNGAGGNIRLIPTTVRSRANLVISYGYTGGAAGMATVGATSGAWVHLNPGYNARDALDPWYRIEVMALFTHELGHVLGFGHTTAKCSTMNAVLDVGGCGMLPAALPGYYKCRTIDPALLLRFITTYGGTARYPASYCLIDPLPSQLAGVAFSGGASAPVKLRWARPSYLPSGSRVQVRIWSASACGSVPTWAESVNVSATVLAWTDPNAARSGQQCFRVNLVNRLGAGRTPAVRLMSLSPA